ncbi:hypothetical protein D3C86_1170420 [compost metagenome]
MPDRQVKVGRVETDLRACAVKVDRAWKQIEMIAALRRERKGELGAIEQDSMADEPRGHPMHQLQHQFAAQHAHARAIRVRHQFDIPVPTLTP